MSEDVFKYPCAISLTMKEKDYSINIYICCNCLCIYTVNLKYKYTHIYFVIFHITPLVPIYYSTINHYIYTHMYCFCRKFKNISFLHPWSIKFI